MNISRTDLKAAITLLGVMQTAAKQNTSVQQLLPVALGDIPSSFFKPNAIERQLLRLAPSTEDGLVAEAWRPSSLANKQAESTVEFITRELLVAAPVNHRQYKLGGYFCGKRRQWTDKPELIACELNDTYKPAQTIAAMDVMLAQKELGVWARRRNRSEWEFAA